MKEIPTNTQFPCTTADRPKQFKFPNSKLHILWHGLVANDQKNVNVYEWKEDVEQC